MTSAPVSTLNSACFPFSVTFCFPRITCTFLSSSKFSKFTQVELVIMLCQRSSCHLTHSLVRLRSTSFCPMTHFRTLWVFQFSCWIEYFCMSKAKASWASSFSSLPSLVLWFGLLFLIPVFSMHSISLSFAG